MRARTVDQVAAAELRAQAHTLDWRNNVISQAKRCIGLESALHVAAGAEELIAQLQQEGVPTCSIGVLRFETQLAQARETLLKYVDTLTTSGGMVQERKLPSHVRLAIEHARAEAEEDE